MLNNQQSTKAANIKAVMDNPQLSKLIKDALGSPLGSTKRQKAKSVLSSLDKTRQNHLNDGMGGNPYSSLESPYPDQGMSSIETGPTPSAETYLNKPTETPQDTPSTTVDSPDLSSPYPGYQGPYPAQQEKVDVVPGLPSPKKQETTDIEPPYGATSEGIQKWYQENPEQVDQWLTNITGVSPESVTETEISRPSNMPADMWSSLKENVEGRVGAESWKYNALSKLKEWFPDVPEEDLPVGAIWTDEIPVIKERLNEEYQLNSLLDNVEKLDSQGLTIEDDLQAYVRGRDEYIKNIDKMINNVNDIYTERDVSDPRVRKMLDKYRDYLYMSKGRQEVRYTDYVNNSIKEHEARLERATNDYNSNLKQFTSALSEEKNITEEKYDMYSDMLTDMYDSLDKRETEIQDITDNELSKLASDLKNASNIKDYLEDLSGEDTGLDFELTNANLNKSLNNYIANHSNSTNPEEEWNALSDLEKRKWMSNIPYNEVIDWIFNAQEENVPYDEIKKEVESRGYTIDDFSGIMEGYEKNFWGKWKKKNSDED